MELQGNMTNPVTGRDFNIPLSIIDRMRGHKNGKDIKLTSIVNQLDLM